MMTQTEREKLFSYESVYLNIGITKNGDPVQSVAVPWFGSSSVYNMRTPDVFLCEEDLYDREILAQLDKFTVLGCYVFCGLESYDVLGRFCRLQDIFLLDAKKLRDLSFMKCTPDWFMLFIHGAVIPDLDALIHSRESSAIQHSYCLGLDECQVEDISALTNGDLQLYELLIRNKWSKAEYNRWQKAKALIYHYFRS